MPTLAPLAAAFLLAAASAVLLAAAIGCDSQRSRSANGGPTGRSEVVEATSASTPTTTSPSARATASAALSAAPRAPRPARKLCDTSFAKPGRDMTRRQPSRLAAPGEPGQGPMTVGGGRWTWINLWAAWCEPCKQEMPRLREFAARLVRTGHPVELVFVSLDDDARQLEQFLRREPAGGLRATYWLREGRERSDWLADLGASTEPELPAQILVDPRGKTRCLASGSVEESDFAELLALTKEDPATR